MFRLVNVGGRPALEHGGRRLRRGHGWPTTIRSRRRRRALPASRSSTSSRGAAKEPSRTRRLGEVVLGPPVPDARQVFGIGLNYRSHAEESGMELPPAPLTFTKFPSCLAGPTADVPLSGAIVDYEAEVVVVIGRTCRDVPVDAAWEVVAGITAGQDISDREVQLTGSPPQFCLGKSFRAYGPTGPCRRLRRRLRRSRRHRAALRGVGRGGPGVLDGAADLRRAAGSSRTSLRSARSPRATSSSPGHPTASAWRVVASSPRETRS